MGLSKRAYAKHRGVSEAAVRKAVLDGRIPTNPDGSIEPEAADAAWNANSEGSRTKGANQGANQSAQGPQGAQTDPAGPNASLVRQVLQEEGQSIGDAELSLTHVRMAVGILKAREQSRENDKARGELVAIETVAAVVAAEYATVRANLMAMPGDVADDLVGLSAMEAEELLASKVSEILNELSADGSFAVASAAGDRKEPDASAPSQTKPDPVGGQFPKGRKGK